MKTVRLRDSVVIEVIPEYALPVEKWYGTQFASQCMEAPDSVGYGWGYIDGEWVDEETMEQMKPEPTPPPEYVTYADLAAAIREGVNAV